MSKKLIIQIAFFIIIIFSTNWIIVNFLNPFPIVWLLQSHLIFSILLLTVVLALTLTIRYYIGLAGYAFVGMMFVKAFVVFTHLALFNSEYGKQEAYILNFSLLYLLYLFFSMYVGLQLIKQKSTK